MTSRWSEEKDRNPKVDDIKFVLYRRVWALDDRKMERYKCDPAFCRMIAKQSLHDFNSGLLHCSASQTVDIVAYSVALYRKAQRLTTRQMTWKYLSRFIPKWARSLWRRPEWIEQIAVVVNELSSDLIQDAIAMDEARIADDSRHWKRELLEGDIKTDPEELGLDETEEIQLHAEHLESISKRVIALMIDSDHFGLSLFCGYIIDVDEREPQRVDAIFKMNDQLLLWTTMDHRHVLMQYHFGDLLDLEVIYVQMEQCLQFTVSDRVMDEADVSMADTVVFQTDEAIFIADHIGALQQECNDKFHILY